MQLLQLLTKSDAELNTKLVTESPRRYISDETVGGFIYVPSMSQRFCLCSIYVPEDIVRQIRGEGFWLASQKNYIGSWFSSREELVISL